MLPFELPSLPSWSQLQYTIFYKSFSLNVGNTIIEPTYWQAVAIVLLLFLLVFTIARMRYLYLHWSIGGKSPMSFFVWGFLLALIIEGIFVIFGKTIITEFLAIDNAPKPISTVIEGSREKIIDVLGVQDEIPTAVAKSAPTYQTVVKDYKELSEDEKGKARAFMCMP